MRRHVVCVTAITLATLALLQPTPLAAAPCWQLPVNGWVTDPFRPPSCPYCAGNRGIEFQVGRAGPVRAVASGEVTYSGSVAGVRYVVVRHANGWKVTYGRLTSTTVRRGDRIVRGSRLGEVSTSLYFGLRVGGEYRDPAPYLGRLIGRARLIPIDGSPPRAAPPPVWRCAS